MANGDVGTHSRNRSAETWAARKALVITIAVTLAANVQMIPKMPTDPHKAGGCPAPNHLTHRTSRGGHGRKGGKFLVQDTLKRVPSDQ
jgi:hypothetical protein